MTPHSPIAALRYGARLFGLSRSYGWPILLVLVVSGIGLVLALPQTLAGPIFILVVASGLGFIAPRWALWGLLIAYPFHPLAMRMLTVDANLSGLPLLLVSAWKEAALAGLLASVTWGAISGIGRWRIGLFDCFALALLALITIWTAFAPDFALALNAWRLFAFPLGIYAAVGAGLIRPRSLVFATPVLGAALAALGLVQSLVLGWPFILRYHTAVGESPPATYDAQFLEVPRAIATLVSPNELGMLLAIFAVITFVLLPVAMCRAMPGRLLAAALTLILVGVAATVSRTSLLALVGGLVAVGILGQPAWRTAAWKAAPRIAVSFGTAILVILLLYANTGALDLFWNTLPTLTGDARPPGSVEEPLVPGRGPGTGLDGAAADPSTLGHLVSIQEGVRLIATHPAGVGLGTVGSRTLERSEPVTRYAAESWYLAMGLSLGWPGLVWATSLPLAMIAWAWRRRRMRDGVLPLAMAGVATVLAVGGVLLPTATEPVIGTYVWALLGLAMHRARTGRPAALWWSRPKPAGKVEDGVVSEAEV